MAARKAILETAVMDALWEDGGWLTPAEVQERLTDDRSRAYTTVMTALVRLWRKDRLQRRKRGRAYEYQARRSKDEYLGAQMEELLGTATDRGGTLNRFVDELSASDRRKLREMLEDER